MKPVLDADYLNFNSSRAPLKLERSGRREKDRGERLKEKVG